ncbi:MAG: NrdH-redoxin [Candidatus Magasanikbacteria bacterium RIFCSPHIGHO2_01_FULL_33_34]|uniref:NrdH-redoxin n=1 Tax=Candidatus Magasanikbacteria bacterium RIFCSPHIGHO2_01_FULL_33_34 TaxID=1798671 RepID=A0A1F6LI31_9BACT|nr:MAG: NrdH-redoxin [Candidatus Magasanikbacteria bacterium RIFCSPHIGHO2_01_FULL_33_34]OGH65182.1 MAG: NrdH-redoxin [Candidatus Magasanikbacteria bacterium RIFCSPHIGHO2_02_FULL_33_17]OGH75273.1 MAG: NrdH-redoxin [Candidatus Magasanikbacteria bacterium RIFCSPLOWO2_01_FULL_33_34]
MKVEIYSTPTCPYCLKAKEYFKENKVEFVEHNVAEDQDRGREMVEKSGQMGVPVILIGDEVVVGFNKSKIDKALGL